MMRKLIIMVKKIGNLFPLIIELLFLTIIATDPDIVLTLLNNQEQKVNYVVVGRPFVVEVAIVGQHDSGSLDVAGIDQFKIESRNQMYATNVINGIATSKTHYRYILVAPHTGVFTLGPARIKYNNNVVQSSSLTFEVRDAVKEQRSANQEALFIVTLDKETAFIGQKVNFSMKFLYEPHVELAQIIEPNLSSFSGSLLTGPFRSKTERNGITYQSIEWHASLFPNQIGALIIPELRAEYTVPMRNNHMMNTMFFHALGMVTKKDVFSNPVTLNVEPLPPYNGTVHGVGFFTHFNAQIDRAQAQEGAGIVLRLSIEGDGDMQHLAAPVLKLSDNFTAYESKSFVDEKVNPQGLYKKTFEYIVQATKVGNYEIPAQEFVFFDVKEQQYKKLSTAPLSLVITASASSKKVIASKQETSETIDQVKENDDELMPLITSGPLQYQEPKKISWYLFLLMIIVPLLVLMLQIIVKYYQSYKEKHKNIFAKKYAYAHAYKKIVAAKKVHNQAALYDIFMHYCADRFQIPNAELSADSIDFLLKNKGIAQQEREQWDNFLAILAQAVFFKQQKIDSKNDLFMQAQQWLSWLEKI